MKNKINETYIKLISVEAFQNLRELAEKNLKDNGSDAFSRGLYEGMRLAYGDAMSRAREANNHWELKENEKLACNHIE